MTFVELLETVDDSSNCRLTRRAWPEGYYVIIEDGGINFPETELTVDNLVDANDWEEVTSE